MSFPPRPPLVPYGIAPGVVTMPMATHVMVGAYGAGGARGALLPAPAKVIARGPARANGSKDDGPPVTVFIGNITARAPDAMIRALLGACGAVLSWKRVSAFGFCEFANPEAALRCVRLLHDRQLHDKRLLARTDGKMQALVDSYKTEQRSRLGAEGAASYLDGRQRALDEAAERRLAQVLLDYQDDLNNYETLQKEEAISKTARVLEEADISEEKRDVIHREIGKFRESMKEEAEVVVRRKREAKDEPRADREPRPDREPRSDREPRPDREPRADREPRSDREPRPDREPRADREPRPEREPRPDREARGERERESRGDRETRADRDTRNEREPRGEREARGEREPRGEREARGERDDKERERDKERRRRSTSRSKERREERDKDREREREEREREREVREREREREARERERERERERDRERERERDRERERSRDRDRERGAERGAERGGARGGERGGERGGARGDVELRKEKELEEEARDRKRRDKKAREKEAAYQDRLRNWEARERRKAKEYEKERERERCREEEREREAKRLKEFLEDYDDERDDHKYYKSKELQRRLGARVREAEGDARERAREQEELSSLRAAVWGGRAADDPAAAAAWLRARRERERQYAPRLLVDASLGKQQQHERELQRARQREDAREQARARAALERERYLRAQASRQLPTEAETIDSDDSGGGAEGAMALAALEAASGADGASGSGGSTPPPPRRHRHHRRAAPPSTTPPPPATPDHSSDGGATPPPPASPDRPHGSPSAGASPISISFKHKLSPSADTPAEGYGLMRRPHAAFAADDDDTPPHLPDLTHRGKEKKDKDKGKSSKGESDKDSKSAEEKRKHIKSLIDKIPTQKEQLFQYKLDPAQIDNALMEKKIRPWINKKIIEYIGEPEPTLVDFICSKVLAGSAPQGILDDVQMVLDDEAEVFVVKMWRLLIYELEAARAGLHK